MWVCSSSRALHSCSPLSENEKKFDDDWYSQRCVLLLSEDGIVGLQVVLLQQFFAVVDLNIEQGVAQSKDGIGHDDCNERKCEVVDASKAKMVVRVGVASTSAL